MRTQKGLTGGNSAGLEKTGDFSKLVSLLTLAAGAVAMPQKGNATVIFSNQGGTVSLSHPSFVLNNLLGNAKSNLGFSAHRVGTSLGTSVHSITGGQRGSAAYIRLRPTLVPSSQHLTWNQIPGAPASALKFATAQFSTHSPAPYNHEFLAFEFKDSSSGNAMRYGWIDLSLSNSDIAAGDNLALTINAWAFDDSGAPLATGAVPEPSSASLMALGALALGAKGVRAWRRKRAGVPA